MTSATRASDLIGDRVKTLRARRGLTREQLSERCTDAGAALSASVLVNIETGRPDKATGIRRRDVTVDELLVLARALDVPPVSLFLPDGTIAITPTVEMDATRLLLWVSGEQPPPDMKQDPERLRKWLTVASPLESLRKLFTFMSQVQMLRGIVTAQPERKAELDKTVEDMATCVNHLVGNGVTPPALPGDLVELMTERSLLSYPDAVPTAEA